MNRLVGLSGYAGSGKNTAALCLIERGYKPFAFADSLKEFALEVNPLVLYGYDTICLRDVVEWYGWDKAKGQSSVRRLLQSLGQGCRAIDPEIWVRALEKKMLTNSTLGHPRMVRSDAVITDVRYPNECAMIKRHGGRLIYVRRPGVGPCNSHESEQDLSHLANHVIDNDGSVEDLHRKILEVVGCE